MPSEEGGSIPIQVLYLGLSFGFLSEERTKRKARIVSPLGENGINLFTILLGKGEIFSLFYR